MVASEHLYQTVVLTRKITTGSIHDYLFCYCPLLGILFEVLRIDCLHQNGSTVELFILVLGGFIKYVYMKNNYIITNKLSHIPL